MAYTPSDAARAPALRPRRSVLFVSGASERAIGRARESEADCLVLDLEDMVSPDQKPEARARVAAAIAEGGFGGRELVVRVNGLDTPWGEDDIAWTAPLDSDALLLPKIDDADALAASLARIDRHGGAGRAIWILAETPRAILAIDRIAAASGRVAAILMGTEDLIKSTGIGRDPERTGLIHALSRCVLAARAQGIAAIDGVYLEVKNEAGLSAACQQGAILGFDGKALIHPAQIAAANAAFGRDAA